VDPSNAAHIALLLADNLGPDEIGNMMQTDETHEVQLLCDVVSLVGESKSNNCYSLRSSQGMLINRRRRALTDLRMVVERANASTSTRFRMQRTTPQAMIFRTVL